METQKGVVGSSTRKGFTLVELLVVIAIIALLLSILMPALAKVRKRAESVICNTHFKEMGTLSSLYAYDNNGKVPSNSYGARMWWYLLGDYYFRNHKVIATNVVGSREDIEVFHCPVEWKKKKARNKAGITSAQGAAMGMPTGGEYLYQYNWFFMFL